MDVSTRPLTSTPERKARLTDLLRQIIGNYGLLLIMLLLMLGFSVFYPPVICA